MSTRRAPGGENVWDSPSGNTDSPRRRGRRPRSARDDARLYLQVQSGGTVAARTRKGDDTRRLILAAATDLFHKQGVSATSPDQVIEASGTGKGQFYHYFRNKEGL